MGDASTIYIALIPPFSPTAPFLAESQAARLREAGIIAITDREGRPLPDAPTDKPAVRVTGKLGRKKYLRLAARSRTPILVWTDEPRHDWTFTPRRRGFGVGPDVHVMNCYTGDVFVDNFRFALMTEPLAHLDENSFPGFTNRKAIALMTYREHQPTWSIQRDGVELDLCVTRCEIALKLQTMGLMDICGQSWPDHVELIENSRGHDDDYQPDAGWGTWQDRKYALLADYPFNMAFENTNAPCYATEKIWDAIRGRCLPIYLGTGNRIDDDFPKDSFLDYTEFGSAEALGEAMRSMTVEAYRRRMNRCIDVHNATIADGRHARSQARTLERLIDRLREIAGR